MQPYLMKCAPYTQWNQEILTCDWARGSYRSSASRETSKNSGYNNNQIVNNYQKNAGT